MQYSPAMNRRDLPPAKYLVPDRVAKGPGSTVISVGFTLNEDGTATAADGTTIEPGDQLRVAERPSAN